MLNFCRVLTDLQSGSIEYQDFQSAKVALQMPIFMASGLQIPMNEFAIRDIFKEEKIKNRSA